MYRQKRQLLFTLLASALGLSDLASAQTNTVTLESQVKGNQEQPNVLSIVPWKQADDYSRIDRGIEADIGRLFQHLDEDEFARQQYFYQRYQTIARQESANAESDMSRSTE